MKTKLEVTKRYLACGHYMLCHQYILADYIVIRSLRERSCRILNDSKEYYRAGNGKIGFFLMRRYGRLPVLLEHGERRHHGNGPYHIRQGELEVDCGIEKECGSGGIFFILEPQDDGHGHARQRIEPDRGVAEF